LAATREGGPVEHAGKMVDEAKAFAAGISRRAEEIQQSVKEFDARGRIDAHPVAFVGGAGTFSAAVCSRERRAGW